MAVQSGLLAAAFPETTSNERVREIDNDQSRFWPFATRRGTEFRPKSRSHGELKNIMKT
jgi:hypothetical protein